MGNFKDLTGQKFGRLTVVGTVGKRGNYYYWKCRCDCGNEITTRGTNLTSGATKSCGCLNLENVRSEKKRKLNIYYIKGETVYVELSNTKETMVCDLEDWEKLKNCTWHKGKTGYAETSNVMRNERQRIRKFHIEIMGKREGFVIDHINRNSLDNRKNNLRFVSQHANTTNQRIRKTNTSGITGVFKRRDTGKWSAGIMVDGRAIRLGCYNTKEEAAEARRKGEEKYFKPLFENNNKQK